MAVTVGQHNLRNLKYEIEAAIDLPWPILDCYFIGIKKVTGRHPGRYTLVNLSGEGITMS